MCERERCVSVCVYLYTLVCHDQGGYLVILQCPQIIIHTHTDTHTLAVYFCSAIDFVEQLRSITRHGLDVLT